jgi:hypothetical protein
MLQKRVYLIIIMLTSIVLTLNGYNLTEPSFFEEDNINFEQYINSDDYISKGVTVAFKVYLSEDRGMVGLHSAVEKCYQKIDRNSTINDIKRCFAIDLSGYYFDSTATYFLKLPPNEFFLQKNVEKRVKKALGKISLNYSQWKYKIENKWVPIVIKQYEKTYQKSFHKQ